MRLKLFRAPHIAQAMARVRAELGEDALILATRRVADGVEVTAALEPEDDAPQPLSPIAATVTDRVRHAALEFHGLPERLRQALRHGELATALAQTLTFGDLPLHNGAPPLLLIGPPGAGKTLTAVRLATRLVLAGGLPLVITADGRRAGAIEQLAAFTRLLNLDLVVANHPVTLGRALARRKDGTPTLIDTAGTDLYDPSQCTELAALAATAKASIALVLPAGLDQAEAAELGAAYAALGARLLVVTRLDIVRRLGSVLAAAAAGKLVLTEAGIGPSAADSLVPLTADWLAGRLLATRPVANPEHHA